MVELEIALVCTKLAALLTLIEIGVLLGPNRCPWLGDAPCRRQGRAFYLVFDNSILALMSTVLRNRTAPARRHVLLIAVALTVLSTCALHDIQRPLHPAFGVTRENLTVLTETLPDAVRQRVLAEPVLFLDLMEQTLKLPSDLFVLVDGKHALASYYRPADLVEITGHGLTLMQPRPQLRAMVLPDLVAMTTAARVAGTDVRITSAYRSFDEQAVLFDDHVERYGLEQASIWVARAGHSQHQLGTAIDVGSNTVNYWETGGGRWILDNAARFGFSLSYPEGLSETTGYRYEPWHYRYLGQVGTELERRFFGGVQQVFLVHYWPLLPALRPHAGAQASIVIDAGPSAAQSLSRPGPEDLGGSTDTEAVSRAADAAP